MSNHLYISNLPFSLIHFLNQFVLIVHTIIANIVESVVQFIKCIVRIVLIKTIIKNYTIFIYSYLEVFHTILNWLQSFLYKKTAHIIEQFLVNDDNIYTLKNVTHTTVLVGMDNLDYYPFGMEMAGRKGNVGGYRYSFGGHEKDDEVSGNGNYLAFGDYGYNPRLSRRFNIDPMIGTFPWMSPYAVFNNNPIYFADPTGLSPESDSPILDTDGNLLGTDDQGWTGEAIVMDENDFEQGMKHEKALDKGKELGSYGEGIRVSDADWNTVVENGGTEMTPTVENKSDETIFYKPEGEKNGINMNPGKENDGAYPIAPNTDLYAPVDGVNVKGYMYKVPDEVSNVYVAKNGVVSLRSNSFKNFLLTEIKILDLRIHYLSDWKALKNAQ